MKELFTSLPTTTTPDILLDTCFFVSIFEKHQEKELEALESEKKVALTSFNAEELIHIHHKLNSHTVERIRKHLKKGTLSKHSIDVHPGDRSREKSYVDAVDVHLLKHIADPSDAVLIAAALLVKAQVFTKDKHHLFTAELENYLHEKGVYVYKTFHDFTS